ncbi:hypothetical protein [Dietzia alimentaria]|uniref:hypothetical protein n=1 Tax=Dietzia alimentaria TaxID=665550 RepID=UPI00029A30FA|nr:hypothetical protein [Dietzia alimentaria]
MADHLDVDPAVLSEIAVSFDDRSRDVDEAVLPDGVDAGIATADVLLLLGDLSADLGEIAGGMAAMSVQLSDSRQLYLDADADAAEAVFLAGGGG